jgi:hypothetical protein
MTVRCAGPAQYASDPTNAAYSYFAAELVYMHRTVQLVVTGPPITAQTSMPVAPTWSSTTGAVVDLYDNSSANEYLASSGSVVLDTNGWVTFSAVQVTFMGRPTMISGTLNAAFGGATAGK